MTTALPHNRELLYRVIAAHESGHELMYINYGWIARAFLECDFNGHVSGGITAAGGNQLTPFQCATVGWAGIIAEHVSGYVLRPQPALPELAPRTIGEWARMLWSEFRYLVLSREDRSMIDPLSPEDKTRAAIFTHRAFTGPFGSSLLYRRTQELVDSFRQEHVRAAQQAGTVACGSNWGGVD
jgi:hypothetical protein